MATALIATFPFSEITKIPFELTVPSTKDQGINQHVFNSRIAKLFKRVSSFIRTFDRFVTCYRPEAEELTAFKDISVLIISV